MIPLVLVSLALTCIPAVYSANATAQLPSIWMTVNTIGPQSLVQGLRQSPQAEEIEDAFNQKNITLFLPSQTAVQDAIQANILDFQSNNTLQQLLRHISPGIHYATSLTTHKYLQSNDSSSNQVPLVVGPNLQDSSLLQISSGMFTANIIKRDIHCSNGVIHIVDEFLRAPIPTLDTVERMPELEHHELLIKSLNLTDVIAGPNKTVLAPVNNAWDSANSSTMPYGVLVHNLKYQVIDGIYLQNTLFGPSGPVSLPTNNRNFTVTFQKSDNNELLVVGMAPTDVARVVRTDIVTTEGVIYLIDKVLSADPSSSKSGDSGGQLAAGPLNPSETQTVSAADLGAPNAAYRTSLPLSLKATCTLLFMILNIIFV